MAGPPFVYPVRMGLAPAGQAGALVTGSLALLFDPTQVSLTYDPNVISTGDGASITGAVRVALASPPLPTFAPVTTVDATSTPLATIPTPIPVGGTLYFEGVVTAALGYGQVNANLGPGIWKFQQSLYRIGAGAPSPGPASNSKPPAPFTAALGGPTARGTVNAAFSGNSVVLSVIGFVIKEAWTSGHTYSAGDGNTTPGDFVTSGGNVYLCTTGGVAGATPPSGTGTGISDGTDVWAYVAPANGSQVPARWTFVLTALVTGS